MSLINKLLQDLEKREAHFDEPPGSVLDGLYSAYDVERQPARRGKIILVIFGFMILASALVAILVLNPISIDYIQTSRINTEPTGFSPKSGTPDDSRPVVEIAGQKPTMTEIVHKDEPVIKENTVVHSPHNIDLRLDHGLTVNRPAGLVPAGFSTVSPELPASPSASTVKMERAEDGLVIRFQLPKKVPYQVYTLESPHRIVFELDDTRIQDELPDFSNIENIVAVRKHLDKNGQSRFVIESDMPYVIDQSNIQQGGDHYVLQVRLLSADTDTPTDAGFTATKEVVEEKATVNPDHIKSSSEPITIVKGDIVKSAREPVIVSETKNLLYQGERLYRQGKIAEALDRLYASVESDPRHRVARTTLALRLSEQQQTDLAVKILQEGLAIDPDIPDWALVLAQIHMRAGRLAEAEKVLSGVIPPVVDYPDYHALYAAVLQKREKHRMAAEIYRKLLQVNPDNGIWWMGLAISLEAISMSSDARFAYRNALAVKSLTPETQQYIIERIRILEQQIENEPS